MASDDGCRLLSKASVAKRRKPSEKKVPEHVRVPWSHRLSVQASGLVLLVLIAYWNSLSGSFLWDDYLMLDDSSVKAPGFGWGILRLSQSRPLTYLTFHWNYLAGGANPFGYHLENLLLHVVNVTLVLLIARRHLPPLPSFLAAGIFAVHPLNTEAVTYIFSRSTLLATFFALLAFRWFLQDRLAWSVAAFALSLLAKEETVALPAVLFLYDAVRQKWRLRIAYYASLCLVAALAAVRLFYLFQIIPLTGAGFHLKSLSVHDYALTQARVIWMDLRLFILPLGLNADHDVSISRGLLTPPSTLIGLLALALTLTALAWLAWHGKQPALWALGFFLLISPSSSIVPLSDVMAERRAYFPLSCLVMAAAWLLVRVPRVPVKATTAAILGLLLVATIARNRTWQTPKSFWTDIVQKSPGKPRGYTDLAGAYVGEGELAQAQELVDRSLELDPKYGDTYLKRGLIRERKGDAQGAIRDFQKAMSLAGEYAPIWAKVGTAYLQLGLVDQAAESYRRALELDPANARACLGLGTAYISRGDLGRGRELLERGLRSDPDSAGLHANLALVMLSQGDAKDALDHFQRAMVLSGESSPGWNFVGAAYMKLGDLNPSAESFRRSIALDPCNINPRENLIDLLVAMGKQSEASLVSQVPANCHLDPAKAQELQGHLRLSR